MFPERLPHRVGASDRPRLGPSIVAYPPAKIRVTTGSSPGNPWAQIGEERKELIGGELPANTDGEPDLPTVRQAVADCLRGSALGLFDFVLVDEGQDLDTAAYELLIAIARHITACMDHKQQILDVGSDLRTVRQLLGIRGGSVTLTETFRCCPLIVRLASHLIHDARERDEYLRQVKTANEKETPLLYLARDSDEEKEKLTEIVKSRCSLLLG